MVRETRKLEKIFDSWLVGDIKKKQAAAEFGLSVSQFQRRIDLLWNQPVEQALFPASEFVVVDGKGVGHQILLIASNSRTINWLWAPSETSYSWNHFLSSIPEPQYLVCDGQKGLFKAIREVYTEDVKVQRCLFHIWLNIRTLLTLGPKGHHEQKLLILARSLLCDVETSLDADIWKYKLDRWYENAETYLKEKTVNPDPEPGKGKWWYTHGRCRSAYHRLSKNIPYFFHFTNVPGLPKTTNLIEGGINSPLQKLIIRHNGMPPNHQQKMIETYLKTRNLSTRNAH